MCYNTAPVLGYPDPQLNYAFDTDPSDVRVEVVLLQIQYGEEPVISHFSKTLSSPEKNACVIHKQPLANIKAVKYFGFYPYWQQFALRSDNTTSDGYV